MIDEGILIDRHRLEDECSSAPAFFDYYQTKESDLKAEKESFEHSQDLKIRKMNDFEREEKYGTSKSTEAAITAMVKSDPEFVNLNRRWLDAMASRKSWEKKIDMLDTLAKLHGQGYFAKIEGKKDTVKLIAAKVKKQIAADIEKRGKTKPKRPKS